MFYTQNIIPPSLNVLIPFSYLPPHLFCKTNYEQQLNDKTSKSFWLVWNEGTIFIVTQSVCNPFMIPNCEIPLEVHIVQFCFMHYWSEFNQAPEICILLDINAVTWQKKKHKHPQIRAGNGCHTHSKNTGCAVLRTKGKTAAVQHILHKTCFLTRLQWLHPPLAEGNNYRCGLNPDLVVFSSQWNMGPSLK